MCAKVDAREKALAEMFEDLGGEPTAEYRWLERRLCITRATLSATKTFLLQVALDAGGVDAGNLLIDTLGAASVQDEE